MKRIISVVILLIFLWSLCLVASADNKPAQTMRVIGIDDIREDIQPDRCNTVNTCVLYGGVSTVLNNIGAIDMEKDIIDISDDELDELARLIMCEAGGEDMDGKVLVGNVVMNRVKSSKFPDDIISVIRQKRGKTYQFSPVGSGKIDKVEPSDECYEAIDMILQGYDISDGALYFESCVGESWHSRNLDFIFKHGGHRFYK